MTHASRPPLAGVRVIESSLLGPGAIGAHLADLGAEVIKVESPSGDYIRQMTWPIIEGTSLLHLHVNRGKRSVALDLRKPEGVQIYRDLAKDADVVIEAMRPGSVIVDLAAMGGGNCELTRAGESVKHGGVTILGPTNAPADIPYHSSQMYAKNVSTFLANLVKEGALALNLEDEIIRDTLITRDRQVVNPRVRELLGLETAPAPEGES